MNANIRHNRANMANPKASPGLLAVIAYDGLSLFEFGCVVEVFGLARPELGKRWYTFAVCGAEPGLLRGVGGVHIQPPDGLELLDSACTIIVPGWRGVDAPVPEALCKALRLAHERGSRILSICTGAFVLAAAGLLDGRPATTHWRHAAALAARYPRVMVQPDKLYVDAGSILTSAGSASGIDLCLHLIRHDLGPSVANQVARRLVMPPQREGGQAQYIEEPVSRSANASLAPLQDKILSSLDQEWSIARMAAFTNHSVRSLQRHFVNSMGVSPGEWLLKQRIARARALLEESDASVESIAAQVGFGESATLRAQFRVRLGTTPSDYRRRFKPTK